MYAYLVYFYKTSSGKKVIDEFISKLEQDTQTKVRNAIRILRQYGLLLLNTRWVKKIWRNPSIYELRVRGKTEIRLLFSFYKPQLFAVVDIFIKKTNRIPKKEINLAIKRIRGLNGP